MAGEPLGMGELKHPQGGNALLTTRDVNGKTIDTLLWINRFSTDLNIQIDTAQTRVGLKYRPIRFAERWLSFTTIWNVLDRPKYEKLGRIIRDHWTFNFNELGQATPMTLKYYGANKTWHGFIENWDTAYALTDVLLAYPFRMRIFMTETQKNDIAQMSSAGILPFAPTAAEVSRFGDGWYSSQFWIDQVKNGKIKNPNDMAFQDFPELDWVNGIIDEANKAQDVVEEAQQETQGQ